MSTEEIILKGIPICHGIAIGTPYVLYANEEPTPYNASETVEDVEAEIARYRKALTKTQENLRHLQEKLLKASMSESASILDAQLQLTMDLLFITEVEEGIRHSSKNAEIVLFQLIHQTEKKFQALDNPFFQERFKDIKNIARQVIDNLRSITRTSLSSLPPNSIIFSKELSPMDTAEANIGAAHAFVTQCDNSTSHTAILARSRGTPYVSSIDFNQIGATHRMAIVDGRTGEVILNPTQETLLKYEQMRVHIEGHFHSLNNSNLYLAETYDGYFVRLSANVEMASELDLLHQHKGDGVGLFRSEYIYLKHATFPTEDEQTEIYIDLVKKMKGLPIVIRAFDIGGDKQLDRPSYTQGPFLGYRAIRFLLREKQIFKAQLRAILRASVHGSVSVMFPLIATFSELLLAKGLITESQQELKQQGVPFGDIRTGCMIEVPSAALIADLLARESDFLSIGTNDLLQYSMAIDRTGQENELYTPTHPSMLRLIQLVVRAANLHGIPVSMCGEMAADPRYTQLLLGLGVQELSVAARYIPIVKNAIRHTSIVEACHLAEEALTLTTAEEIQKLLEKNVNLYSAMVPF